MAGGLDLRGLMELHLIPASWVQMACFLRAGEKVSGMDFRLDWPAAVDVSMEFRMSTCTFFWYTAVLCVDCWSVLDSLSLGR